VSKDESTVKNTHTHTHTHERERESHTYDVDLNGSIIVINPSRCSSASSTIVRSIVLIAVSSSKGVAEEIGIRERFERRHNVLGTAEQQLREIVLPGLQRHTTRLRRP